jgi:hypothetical protein
MHGNIGKKRTKEQREKASIFQKTNCNNGRFKKGDAGYWLGKKKKPFTEEHLKNLSIARKGKKHTEETKIKIALKNKDKIVSSETRKKISEARMGVKPSAETRKKLSESHKRENLSEETLKKLRDSQIKRVKEGRNHLWKGGITPVNQKIRMSIESRLWREAVFARDNWTCQNCGDNKGGNLQAHHIKSFSEYEELRFALDNGITLCIDCHKLTDNWGGKGHK